MPRLIFKCPYIQGGSKKAAAHLSNYVRYMATREGAQRLPEQTAQLFTTGSVLADGPDDIIRADDVIEMGNHFRMFDWMLDHVDDPVDKTMVCTMQCPWKAFMPSMIRSAE